MPNLSDNVRDNGLAYAVTNGTRLDICSALPTTYAEATSTYTLGNKTGLTLTGPADGAPDGRSATIPAIADGSVTGTGTAGYWALTNNSNELIAAQALSAQGGVTSGNTFTLDAITIRMPDLV